jgi:hypothetical protein
VFARAPACLCAATWRSGPRRRGATTQARCTSAAGWARLQRRTGPPTSRGGV